ncbi:Unannotated [Lentimonas sp. CC4]|nr:Unannotated [Lentimonas sp. CC4]CAA6683852.1 Unannotated [Lentimonas sp. CC6]CAA7077752.1 Unannotated [Lentimonas sp. CC4]CAA7169686.1 Unannotated [Lentimonas sp. CC21]CAA7179507.1 Unannotated [Lentimonas sp. CC8]
MLLLTDTIDFSMKNQRSKYIISILAITLASLVQASSWTGGGTADDWNDTANWLNGEVAGLAVDDNALFVGAEDSNTPTADFTFADSGADVNLRAEVTLTINNVTISGFDVWRLGGNNGHGGGHLVLNGGTLNGGELLVASAAGATSDSSLTVTGGRLVTDSFDVNALGLFTLTGDAATFSVGNTSFENGSRVNFIFDSTGISSIATSGVFTIGASSAELNIDLTHFAGSGVFDLVTFGSVTGSYRTDNITYTGLAGRSASIEYDDDRMSVRVSIPEQRAYALIAGCFGLSAVMLRRRRS